MNKRFENNEYQPLCRFGPGGDFIADWPSNPLDYYQLAPNKLTKVLASLSEIINALGKTKPPKTARSDIPDKSLTEQMLAKKEELKDAIRNAKKSHPKTIADTKDDSGLYSQPLLFPDDCRTGQRSKHKPKHRVRAHRRVAKKKTTLSLATQGSLFETNFKSAKSA